MKALYPMRGVITTVNTPFNEDLTINWSDLRRTAEAALEAGVSGFLAPCFASEIDELTNEERYRMVTELLAVTHQAGHGIVMPNVRGKTKDDCVEQAKRYLDLGVDGVNIFMPTVTEESYRELVAAVDALHPPFLCLQDTKDNELRAPFVKSMFDEFESFRCIKIETANPNTVTKTAARIAGNPVGPCRRPFCYLSDASIAKIKETVEADHARGLK